MRIPSVADLMNLAEQLGAWQTDPWPGHLHPGDLGWHSMVGIEQLVTDLRVWSRGATPVAIGMLDGVDLFRMTLDPSVVDEHELAAQIARDIEDPRAGVLPAGEVVVEARGAKALQAILRTNGWGADNPWTPLVLDLTEPLDLSRLDQAGLHVEEVGPEHADAWIGVHWSSFKGTPLEEPVRRRLSKRWTSMATGPFSELGHHLIAYDPTGKAAAITTVWEAPNNTTGLIEPLAVHRDHQGHGYGVAITLAGARVLQRAGATKAAVAAENSNNAALATYAASGFLAHPAVADLKRRH